MKSRLTHLLARRTEARRTVASASNTLAVAATAHMDRVPASADDYWSDLRRGRRWVWGGLLRFIDRCAAIGTPLEVVLAAVDTVRWYALEAYGAEPALPPSPAVVLAA